MVSLAIKLSFRYDYYLTNILFYQYKIKFKVNDLVIVEVCQAINFQNL